MKKKIAKELRQAAMALTIGESNETTRKKYKQLKLVHKSLPKNDRIK